MDVEHSRIYYVGKMVEDHTPIWRYTRLSTLLMLLNGKVFIPTLATLRRGDPAEAISLCRETRERFHALTPEDKECLEKHATQSEKATIRCNQDSDHTQLYLKIWRRLMGERRCAWCWHGADIESMAQWHIYAKDGVAIRSTPLRMRAALSEHDVDSGLIGAVQYGPSEDCEVTYLRPYLSKRECYQHEQEVRLVLPREPGDEDGGIYLPIDGRKLIEEIRISPLLPHGEALGLRAALEKYVNREPGKAYGSLSQISVVISGVMDISESMMDSVEFHSPKRTGIANFGNLEMPFLLSDDIRRGLQSGR